MKLSNIRIVLVQTTHSGNIGAAARAMKNMGLEKLYLVAPKQFPHADASARASGADDLLAAAMVCDTLEDALTGCALVFGASARLRTIAWPQVDPRQCVSVISTLDDPAEVALVFGREHAGLTNEELEQCHYLVHIPANPEFSSLNLAAAVQVLAYEARVACCASDAGRESEAVSTQLATADELAGFYRHLERTVIDIGFLDPDNPRQLMRRLRRLFNRSRLDRMELNILRGILTAAQKGVNRRQ
ncbi:MAG TPA: tRNA (cytosine(32)/uridine(32)-2'-O)-methyltransferase TrmJ [Gammaproteobacteria bacterium]|nr:tRNA (cytosine(32)/uridine(32)-2'-O)-methyltransferase TrmJ [Gammaproteobacteria bacterium]